MNDYERLYNRLEALDNTQAKRFRKLKTNALAIAWNGIVRHLHACKKMGVNPDINAIREVIDDAQNGRSVFNETDTDYSHVGNNYHKN